MRSIINDEERDARGRGVDAAFFLGLPKVYSESRSYSAPNSKAIQPVIRTSLPSPIYGSQCQASSSSCSFMCPCVVLSLLDLLVSAQYYT